MRSIIDDRCWQIFTFGRFREPALPTLTEREQKVYNMLRTGFDPVQTGERMHLSTQAIKVCRQEIRRKGWPI